MLSEVFTGSKLSGKCIICNTIGLLSFYLIGLVKAYPMISCFGYVVGFLVPVSIALLLYIAFTIGGLACCAMCLVRLVGRKTATTRPVVAIVMLLINILLCLHNVLMPAILTLALG